MNSNREAPQKPAAAASDASTQVKNTPTAFTPPRLRDHGPLTQVTGYFGLLQSSAPFLPDDPNR